MDSVHGGLMQPMTYVINSPIANAVLKNAEMNMDDELTTLRKDNNHLHYKIQAKTTECTKLRAKVKECTTELERYKELLNQVSHSLANGTATSHSINLALQNASSGLTSTNGTAKPKAPKKAKKAQSPNCQCCCSADKPFVCDWVNCGKRFRQKPHLDAHRNIHTGRRFICEWPTCGKSFVRKYNLTEHQKLHRDTNPNMCTFPECGKVFSSRYCLVRHQNAQHNLNL